ncbi:PEP-CTERM sorting domain-containing protein [Neptunicella sp. SCSIO 80796]|uniref:PEP-CTERM sorting domain-containing protein n=1 Tax=Neptunicella plasticusilytica TaxID=3117012 RepID=UPI003A4D338C
MKTLQYAALILGCALTSQLQAAAITNGDFSSCDYTGWQQESDFAAPVSGSNDFSIAGSSPNCSAVMNVDYGGIDDAFFYTALFQELDLSSAADSTFLLTLDFNVSSDLTSQDGAFVADYFAAGISDGFGNFLPGLLASEDIDGIFNYNLSFSLDNSFANQTGLFVEFQLILGADIGGLTDLSGSSLNISNVSLVEVAAPQVPEPGSMAIMAVGLAGLATYRRKKH